MRQGSPERYAGIIYAPQPARKGRNATAHRDCGCRPRGGKYRPAMEVLPMQDSDSQRRILTTHVGSLPRPKPLLDLMKARLTGGHPDEAAYEAEVKKAV